MAKRKSLKCTKCDRSFSMAAHLGRHMATIHGRKPAPGKLVRGRRRTPTTSRALTGGAARVLSDIRAARDELVAQQAQLATQLGALDQLLATLDGIAPKPTAGRALKGHRIRGGPNGAREGSLKSYIERVLRATRRPMRRAEVTAAVLSALPR